MAQATESADVAAAKRKRTRSPAYPYVNLEGAIKRVREFYDKEQRNAANINVATKHWGFQEDSSSGSQTIAALISFGLMADEGTGEKRTVRLTQDALRILLDTRPDSVDKAALIKQCALSPKIHKQIWEKWGPDLPSDASLRHTLLFDWETPFNENSVDYFIGEYKSTITFANLSESDKFAEDRDSGNGGVQEDNPKGKSLLASFVAGEKIGSIPPKKTMQEYIVPLSDGAKAVFQWPTILTNEDIEDLQDSLKILERKITRPPKPISNIDEEAAN